MLCIMVNDSFGYFFLIITSHCSEYALAPGVSSNVGLKPLRVGWSGISFVSETLLLSSPGTNCTISVQVNWSGRLNPLLKQTTVISPVWCATPTQKHAFKVFLFFLDLNYWAAHFDMHGKLEGIRYTSLSAAVTEIHKCFCDGELCVCLFRMVVYGL